jgi:hypothetical protein
MDPLSSTIILERLRRALAPEHSVEFELASGGMGSVFLGHDHTLDRPVAIKLLRPELASAVAAERFQTEARTLAGLQHPNVVNIFRVGEADGLFYYVMEYVPGETLEARVRRGKMSIEGATKMGRDLLDGLEAAHRLGVVHRDVKPSNLMIFGRRTLLTDFGIAIESGRGSADGYGTGYTGTPGYMAPEQILGEPATPRTDIFCAGVVLYEAMTGRRWYEHVDDWRGVPRGVAAVLKRALAPTPEDRWPDAASFRRALWKTRSRRYLHRTIAMVVSGLALGAVVAMLAPRFGGGSARSTMPLTIVIRELEATGAASAAADTFATLLVDELRGFPDFTVARRRAGTGPMLTITGRVTESAGTLRIRLQTEVDGGVATPLGAEILVPRGGLTAVAALASDRALNVVWDARSPIAKSLPVSALPRTPLGLSSFLSAERLVAEARWSEAFVVYQRALANDSTCWLCAWRITDVQRWLGMNRDPAYLAIALQYVDSFPPIYRSLVRAAAVPLRDRLDTLAGATEAARGFFLPSLQYGDELFHRGPLVGRTRQEAVNALERAARLRPEYAPTWEHLLWARIAEGDSVGSTEAMTALMETGAATDPVSAELRALLQLGFMWRFAAPDVAAAATQEVLNDPAVAASQSLGAGPRLLPTFDAPSGAVMMGEILASSSRPDLARSGALAKLLGEIALGRPTAARGTARRYIDLDRDPGAELFVAELFAMLARFDDPSAAVTVGRGLAELAAPGVGTDRTRRRATWLLRLTTPGSSRDVLLGEPFDHILRADSLARAGRFSEALAVTDSLAADPYVGTFDPFLRSAIHLLRAEWYEATGNLVAARGELRWHENTDLLGHPTGAPQAAEVDWAFGTLGRWRRATVMERANDRGEELCGALRGAARVWGNGEPSFVARADSARRRAADLGCPGAR